MAAAGTAAPAVLGAPVVRAEQAVQVASQVRRANPVNQVKLVSRVSRVSRVSPASLARSSGRPTKSHRNRHEGCDPFAITALMSFSRQVRKTGPA